MRKKNPELNRECGKRLRECRLEKNMTQEELASASFLSVQQISYIENGKRGMSLESVRNFSEILGVDEKYLLGETSFKNEFSKKQFANSKIDEIDKRLLELLEAMGITLSYKLKTPNTPGNQEGIDFIYKNLQNCSLSGSFPNRSSWRVCSKDAPYDIPCYLEGVTLSYQENKYDLSYSAINFYMSQILNYIDSATKKLKFILEFEKHVIETENISQNPDYYSAIDIDIE